jgi:hypothetical protein
MLNKDLPMRLLFAIFMLGTVASAQMPAVDTKPQSDTQPNETTSPGAALESPPGDPLALPQGKSTVMGGTISAVDPIADKLTLKVFGGGRPMKIFFDERTQVYRDGVKASLRGLRPNDHASIETMLDGTTVFARSIHMLSQAPQGECHGQVVSFDPGTGGLTVSESLSRESIRLRVPAGTTIVREGQNAAASGRAGTIELVKGSLISATFTSDNKGQGIASRIAILATPGDQLSFAGNVTFLDLRSNQFAVQDAQNDQSYKISFDPAALPVTRNLHEGSSVKVTAEFDGSHYLARAITID